MANLGWAKRILYRIFKILKLLIGSPLAYLLYGIVIGLPLGLFSPLIFASITFKNEIGIADLLNVSSTVLVAVVIGLYLNKQYSDQRVEKDLLIENAKEVSNSLKEIHRIFLDNYYQQSVTEKSVREIKSGFKNFSNNVAVLENSIQKCPRMSRISLEEVKEQRRGYRVILTNDPFPTSPYTISSYNNEDKVYRALIQSIQTLILEINRK